MKDIKDIDELIEAYKKLKQKYEEVLIDNILLKDEE